MREQPRESQRESQREPRFDHAHVLDTLRELPPDDPAAIDRILLAVKADTDTARAQAASPKAWPRKTWWRVVAASGAVAAAFIAGVVIGNDRMVEPTQESARAAGTTERSVMGNLTTPGTPVSPVSQVSGASILSPVPFELRTTHATSVSLVGDFNGWDPQATPLQSDLRGQYWSATVPLRPGRYTYAFVVDDNIIPDPNVPGVHDPDYGAIVSVVIVKDP